MVVIKGNFVLNKEARDPVYILFDGGSGIVVIILITQSSPEKQIVGIELFVPSQLTKTNALFCYIGHIAINRILIVIGVGKGEQHFFFSNAIIISAMTLAGNNKFIKTSSNGSES